MTDNTLATSRRRTLRTGPAALAVITISALGAWGATELAAPAHASDHVTVGLIEPACATSDPVLYPCPVVP